MKHWFVSLKHHHEGFISLSSQNWCTSWCFIFLCNCAVLSCLWMHTLTSRNIYRSCRTKCWGDSMEELRTLLQCWSSGYWAEERARCPWQHFLGTHQHSRGWEVMFCHFFRFTQQEEFCRTKLKCLLQSWGLSRPHARDLLQTVEVFSVFQEVILQQSMEKGVRWPVCRGHYQDCQKISALHFD